MNKTLYFIRLSISLVILILAIAGITGILYPLAIFDIQFTPVLQRVFFDYSIAAMVIIALIILLTFLSGRFYCSLLCPFGALQEIICLISRKDNEKQKNLPVKYFISAVTLGLLTGGSALVIRYFEPYTFFGSLFTLSLTGIIAFILIGLLAFFKQRYFCTNLCPVGAVLGLISKFSLFKIYIDKEKCVSCAMCERNCQAGCIEASEEFVDNAMCVKCLKCLGQCYKGAIKYGIKPSLTAVSEDLDSKKVKFSPKRRELITSIAVLTVFAAAFKSGIEIVNRTAKKFKNIILPPGAVNIERMQNKCLNCNLCVNLCPNKIIKKADENFPAVHIDYTKGKKYCKYDCKECSKVCPSGAIRKIPLEEKQKTRIAMAVINSQKCTHCGECAAMCPVKAISQGENGAYIINASKCTGCGACKTACYFGAIDIFAVKEQKVI